MANKTTIEILDRLPAAIEKLSAAREEIDSKFHEIRQKSEEEQDEYYQQLDDLQRELGMFLTGDIDKIDDEFEKADSIAIEIEKLSGVPRICNLASLPSKSVQNIFRKTRDGDLASRCIEKLKVTISSTFTPGGDLIFAEACRRAGAGASSKSLVPYSEEYAGILN